VRLLLFLTTCVVAASSCEGLIGDAAPPAAVGCDVSAFPNARLEQALGEFTQGTWPAFTQGDGQCASCHGVGSGRRFVMAASADETFHQARALGLFNDDPGSLLARVTAADPRTRMPQGTRALPTAVIESLAKTACIVRAYEAQGGVAADEQFPPELLATYTGPANTDYDNAFLNFVQLRAKVKSVFHDDWVRGGVDQFDKNVGLLGGVDFRTHYVEARVATPDFLLGLDVLAPDVCTAAVTNGTGPFAGLDVVGALVDTPAQVTTPFEVEALNVTPPTGAGNASTNPAGYFCYTNCSFTTPITLPAPGTYQVTVRAKAQNDGAGNGPKVGVQLGAINAATPLQFSNTTAYEEKTLTITVTTAGPTTISVAYINDYSDPPVVAGGDRNVYLDSFKVVGPLGAGTGTQREVATKTALGTLVERTLFRPATPGELTNLYALVKDLAPLGPQAQAWSGACEALLRHPDFLFTLPPSIDTATTGRARLLLVALAQQLLGRPPTSAEFDKLGTGGLDALVDDYLASPDFRAYYFNRMQLRIESQGTPESDEAARLWTYVVFNGRSFEEVLAGDYSVDETFTKQPRSPEHGKTGVLTMKGYLNNKPGLPHYNYPARVLSGFMGSIFEVPPEVFDQRGTATAASTVDPSSICFNCHQLLTPLAHQRLRWADDGTYRTTDAQGAAIDDTDRGLVPTYPYKGQGLEAFATKAVRKEPYVRRMINTQFRLLMGRELRSRDDERDLYKQLWDTTFANGGDLRATLRAIAHSPTFQRTR
jgi:hypothetical protein